MTATISDLLGQTLAAVAIEDDDEDDGRKVVFTTSDGGRFQMYHEQSCCETVELIDVNGDLLDLIGAPILQAEVVANTETTEGKFSVEEQTWTFYKLATIKGGVTLRWHGSSNGYYSTDVTFKRMPPSPNSGEKRGTGGANS